MAHDVESCWWIGLCGLMSALTEKGRIRRSNGGQDSQRHLGSQQVASDPPWAGNHMPFLFLFRDEQPSGVSHSTFNFMRILFEIYSLTSK